MKLFNKLFYSKKLDNKCLEEIILFLIIQRFISCVFNISKFDLKIKYHLVFRFFVLLYLCKL